MLISGGLGDWGIGGLGDWGIGGLGDWGIGGLGEAILYDSENCYTFIVNIFRNYTEKTTLMLNLFTKSEEAPSFHGGVSLTY